MKKILNWLKSSKSDFSLFIILLILANLVAYNAFARFDLTSAQSYTLSKASKNLVKNLEEPSSRYKTMTKKPSCKRKEKRKTRPLLSFLR